MKFKEKYCIIALYDIISLVRIMFGYVKIYKDELKCKDFEIFRSYYCGLCRALGKNCSQISRLGLSYDMTFLAIVLSGVNDTPDEWSLKPCLAHPLHKKRSVINSPVLDYVSHMSVLLTYLKLCDDFSDEKSIKALLGKIFFYPAFSKSRKKYPEKYKCLKQQLKKLQNFEKENCSSADCVADCFARLLRCLFTPDFIEHDKENLGNLGYYIGRWIYITDAFSDMEKDFKNKSYNPFLHDVKTEEELLKKINEERSILDITQTHTLASAASEYEFIKVYKNDEIIKNILYLGLRVQQDRIFKSNMKGNE